MVSFRRIGTYASLGPHLLFDRTAAQRQKTVAKIVECQQRDFQQSDRQLSSYGGSPRLLTAGNQNISFLNETSTARITFLKRANGNE